LSVVALISSVVNIVGVGVVDILDEKNVIGWADMIDAKGMDLMRDMIPALITPTKNKAKKTNKLIGSNSSCQFPFLRNLMLNTSIHLTKITPV